MYHPARTVKIEEPATLKFVIYQNQNVQKSLTSIIKDPQSDINRLLGDTRVVISGKSHSSTAQLLFAKGSFSRTIKVRNVSQKCWARGCKSCRIMDTGSMVARKISTVNNWKSANVIYSFICKHFCSEQGTPDYYFGRTMDKLHERVNGNRTHFKTKIF